jgi:hypothetical protein
MNELLKEKIIMAKANLSYLLLTVPKSEISDDEIEIMFALSQDKDIQHILQLAKDQK